MNNAASNLKMLSATSRATVNAILDNIAANYGISRTDAFKEVTGEGAEHLLDYVTGPARAATSAIMQRHAA